METFLDSPARVVRCLATYTDWWQPATSSILHAGRSRRGGSDGIPSGLIDTLDLRGELRRRAWMLPERERQLLFLWYVAQLPVHEIARTIGVTPRHCFRLRARAVRAIVELGEAESAA